MQAGIPTSLTIRHDNLLRAVLVTVRQEVPRVKDGGYLPSLYCVATKLFLYSGVRHSARNDVARGRSPGALLYCVARKGRE